MRPLVNVEPHDLKSLLDAYFDLLALLQLVEGDFILLAVTLALLGIPLDVGLHLPKPLVLRESYEVVGAVSEDGTSDSWQVEVPAAGHDGLIVEAPELCLEEAGLKQSLPQHLRIFLR